MNEDWNEEEDDQEVENDGKEHMMQQSQECNIA